MRRKSMILSVLLLAGGAALAATPNLPMPSRYVEDQADIIAADVEQKLNGLLQELEQKTGAQFIVLTVQSTKPLPIERFTIELVDRWKLGRKGKDDGFLFAVAVQDRAYRFEVGYGLEGFLTDQYCGQVGRNVLVPLMRQNQYGMGIYQATLALTERIARENNVVLTGMPKGYSNPVPDRRPTGSPLCAILPAILFILLIGARGGWPLLVMLGLLSGHNRGYWGNSFGGGGFGGSGGGFGGGFGGFGGGGGGGFGGGGSSGGW